MRPFDGIADLPGERVVHAVSADVEGEGVADVQDRANVIGSCPAQVIITNYRVRLFEPTKGGATLHATVCSGHNLRSKAAIGGSKELVSKSVSDSKERKVVNPYVVLSLTGMRHRSVRCPKRTAANEKTQDPVWNETFIFEGVEGDACLRVELFDRKPYSRDDMLGVSLVRDVALWSGEGDSRQWTESLVVKDRDREVGSIRMRMSCTWHTEKGEVARHCSIPLTSICAVDFKEHEHTVEILTKCARQLVVRLDDSEKAKTVHRTLCDWPQAVEDFVCFSANVPRDYRFSWDALLERLTALADAVAPSGVRTAEASRLSSRWRVDRVANKNYGLCETYPEVLLLPVALRTEDLEASASLRSKGRFPCVSWAHPRNGASIARCSQPQTGVWASNSSAAAGDRRFLLAFAADGCGEITICDCRPYMNAMANRIKGGGTESEADFEGAHHKFLNIGNIHDMSKSLCRLREGVEKQNDFKALTAGVADWLAHIHNLLRGAIYVAEVVESGESVIVHCSEGWDRTSQICSLASLLLDSHYRTVLGFAELIEKDWLLPGHKFQNRHGLTSKSDQVVKDQSPVFLQFIECICQLWRIYPQRFEYTLEFLSFVLYHSYSGRFTNFLGNNERDRAELGARTTGSCLWTEIRRQHDRWLNPAFDDRLAAAPIVPCVVPAQRLIYMEELYTGQCSVWEHGPDLGSMQRRESDVRDLHRLGEVSEQFVRKDMDIETFLPAKANLGMSRFRARNMSNSSVLTRSMRPQSMSSSYMSRITAGSSSYIASSYISDAGTDVSHCFAEQINSQVATLPENLQDAEYAVRHFLGLPDNFPGRPNIEVMSHTSLGDHTRYIIVTKTSLGSESIWQVTRRWSRFDDLRRTLRDVARIAPQVPFPQWTFFQPSQQLKEQRTHHLNSWLQTAIKMLVEVEMVALEGRITAGPVRGSCCRKLAACQQSVLRCIRRDPDPNADRVVLDQLTASGHGLSLLEDVSVTTTFTGVPVKRLSSSFGMRNPSSFLDADAVLSSKSRGLDQVARQDSRLELLTRQESRMEISIPEDSSLNLEMLNLQESRLDLPTRRDSLQHFATAGRAAEDQRRQLDSAPSTFLSAARGSASSTAGASAGASPPLRIRSTSPQRRRASTGGGSPSRARRASFDDGGASLSPSRTKSSKTNSSALSRWSTG